MKSGALITIAAALSIAMVSNEARATHPPGGSPSAPSGGVFLVVRSTSDAVSILRVSTSRKPIVTAKPSLTVAGWEQNPLGAEELIVTLHDKNGKLLGEYGFPTRRIAFADSLGAGGRSLAGGPRGLTSVDLPVHVPSSDDAVFLFLWRVVILPGASAGSSSSTALSFKIPGSGPYGPVALTVDPLGGYPLTEPLPNFHKIELPKLPRPQRPDFAVPKFITDARDLKSLLKNHPFMGGGSGSPPQATPCPSGAAPSQLLGASVAVAGGFNIVILGEGYQATQMDAFHADALNVKDALFAISPFLDFQSKINVYRIDTPSVDAGVDYCPKECPKSLCYRGTNAGNPCSWDVNCPGGWCDPAGKCFKGSNDGASCNWDAGCPGGGTCDPYAVCVGGANAGAVCSDNTDCKGTQCTPTRACHLGTNPGALCTTDSDCPSGTCPPRSGCPPTATDPKSTALEATGEASLLGTCTEFKADFPKVADITCSALAQADVNLTIVLVNCDAYGGMTYPAEKTIFVAARHAPEMIAHEAGHAMAPLGEEYISGVLPCTAGACSGGGSCKPSPAFKNIALPADVTSNHVSWYPLAKTAERSGATFSTIQHFASDNCKAYLPNHKPYGSGTGQKLGLYWGAQYLSEGQDPWPYGSTCQSFHTCRVTAGDVCATMCFESCDPRGADYYRPMPRCMMRFLNEPFCRVCYCELRAVLTAYTGLIVTAPDCR